MLDHILAFIAGAAIGMTVTRWLSDRLLKRSAANVEKAGYLVWKMVDDARIRAGLGMVAGEPTGDLPDRLWVAWREALQRVQALHCLDTDAKQGTAVYRAVNEMGAALGLAPEPGETTWRYHRRQVAHVEALRRSHDCAVAWAEAANDDNDEADLAGNGVAVVARRDGEG